MGYQIRIPGRQTLAEVVKAIAFRLANRMCTRDDAERLAPAIEAALTQRLKSSLTTTDICGAQVMCDETVRPSAWNVRPDPELVRIDPNHPDHVKRFQLAGDGGLDQWLNTLRVSVHSVIPGKFGPPKPEMLDVWLTEELGRYLYETDLCGHTDLCHSATPVKDVMTA